MVEPTIAGGPEAAPPKELSAWAKIRGKILAVPFLSTLSVVADVAGVSTFVLFLWSVGQFVQNPKYCSDEVASYPSLSADPGLYFEDHDAVATAMAGDVQKFLRAHYPNSGKRDVGDRPVFPNFIEVRYFDAGAHDAACVVQSLTEDATGRRVELVPYKTSKTGIPSVEVWFPLTQN